MKRTAVSWVAVVAMALAIALGLAASARAWPAREPGTVARGLAVSTPAGTPTPGFGLSGQVRLSNGTGLPGVDIYLYLAMYSYSARVVATTDANGYYQAAYMNIPGQEHVTIYPVLAGYSFAPETYHWFHQAGVEQQVVGFVAYPGTPPPTPTLSRTLAPTSTPGGNPVIRFSPSSSAVPIGGTSVLDIVVDGVVDLGGYEFTVVFDPDVLNVQGVTLGDFLGSTGRSAVPIGTTIDNAAGQFTFGAFSFGSAPGPTGTGTVAHVTLWAVGMGGTNLTFTAAQLTDTQGRLQGPLTMRSAQVSTIVCTPPPCPTGGVLFCPDFCPGGCGYRCATVTPSHTPTATPSPRPTYTPTSFPGQPTLIAPVDGALLPQPVPPAEWYFAWSARTGPCHGWIYITGPGGRRISTRVDYSLSSYSYEYRYTGAPLPDDALEPWFWSVQVICPMGTNQSETRAFHVAPLPSPTTSATFSPTPLTPTPTPTFTPTITPTPRATPGGLTLHGHVRLRNGTGLPGVAIHLYFGTLIDLQWVVATTDATGYYQTDYIICDFEKHVTIWPTRLGYSFSPGGYQWMHSGDVEDVLRDFVAYPPGLYLPLLIRTAGGQSPSRP